jgi:tetratricopeptide (TPR) repeat protein
VRADVRHQLKQDQIRNATVHWTVEHKDSLLRYGGLALLVVVLAGAAWAYLNHREDQASGLLNQAVRTYNLPLRPAGMAETPEFPSFGSAAERSKKAHEQFMAVANQYSSTRSGEIARYLAGVTEVELGDNTQAERSLQQAADHGNADLAALARMSLAALYRNTGRDTQAIDVYKKVIEKPANAVPKSSAQLQLAALYSSKQQPAEARRLYEQVQKENPGTELGAVAASRIAALPKNP